MIKTSGKVTITKIYPVEPSAGGKMSRRLRTTFGVERFIDVVLLDDLAVNFDLPEGSWCDVEGFLDYNSWTYKTLSDRVELRSNVFMFATKISKVDKSEELKCR